MDEHRLFRIDYITHDVHEYSSLFNDDINIIQDSLIDDPTIIRQHELESNISLSNVSIYMTSYFFAWHQASDKCILILCSDSFTKSYGFFPSMFGSLARRHRKIQIIRDSYHEFFGSKVLQYYDDWNHRLPRSILWRLYYTIKHLF